MTRTPEKNVDIRNFLLDRLESGEWRAGDKLPGARQLAQEAGCSFTYMQSVLESLVQHGVLVSVSRSGTYVGEYWKSRLLPDTVKFFLSPQSRKSEPGRQFIALFRNRFPDLRIVEEFDRAYFEFRVSYDLFHNHREYRDLEPAFRSCVPDLSLMLEEPLASYRIGGRLCGVPFRFSPRVIVYNRRVFAECGVPEPRPNWSWEEFIGCVRQLRKSLPSELVMPYPNTIFHFCTLISRFGGELIDPSEPDPVRVDSPETVRAVGEYFRLLDLLGKPVPLPGKRIPPPEALLILTRQEISLVYPGEMLNEIGAVELPLPENGREFNVPGVELFAVRRECTDERRIRQIVEFLLSAPTQNQIGRTRAGIPVRRSSAKLSLNPDDPLDALFLRELGKPTARYYLYSPELFKLSCNAVQLLAATPPGKRQAFLRQFADAFRFLIRCDAEEPDAVFPEIRLAAGRK
ncbi:MAG: extracellular solute-binding protein [Lentisphaeria bacterium]|nr:extracellular solute-binding protein [Lentisphaeria bacterium]